MTDTEDRLRRALAAAGDAITAEPHPFSAAEAFESAAGSGEVLDIDTERGRRLRRRRWELWLTAAAVLALGVSGAVVGLTDHGQRHRPPAIHRVPGSLHPQLCTVPLPASWRDQLREGVIEPSPSTGARADLDVLGVDTDGYTLAADTATTPQSIVVIGPNRAVRRIWQPRAGTDVHQGFVPVGPPAVVSGRWVVFALRQQTGGDVPLSAFYAANTRTGTVRLVSPGNLAHTDYSLADLNAVDGTVYFSAIRNDNGLDVGPGYIYDYDLASGRRRTLAHGDIGHLWTAGGGVFWQRDKRTVSYRPGSLPARYANDGSSTITDGTREAWIQYLGHQERGIQLRIGTDEPVTVLGRFTMDNYPEIMALSGAYLLVSDNAGLMALDTRTGAQTRIGTAADFAASGGGTVAITSYPAADTPRLAVINTATLPALHC